MNLQQRARRLIIGVLAAALVAGVLASALPARGQAAVTRADAVVLVNSTSTAYQDFARYIQPYLDHFGVPYTIVNLATTPVPSNLQDYALIIIGHNRLDPQHTYLDASEQLLISSAVNAGSGLLNFDSVLADGSFSPYYQYAQTVFGFSYAAATAAANVTINSAATLGNYVVAAQPTNAAYTLLASITPLRVILSAPATALATLGGNPFLIATTYGQGRAVQWTSYDWMRAEVWGYMRGFDDLVWRGIVWAARKPFVMQGLPPFITLRVDDVAGPLWWVDTANQYGWKPWGGLFYQAMQAGDITHLRSLVDAGNMTVSVHSKGYSYDDLFYMGCCSNFPDTVVNQNFAEATAWHITNQISISKYIVPHYYRIGSNTFNHLRDDWGVEFVGTVISPSLDYFGAPRLMLGPFNRYETACGAECNAPIYYADFMDIPEHPELDGQFFYLVTEVRDITNYEWTPDYNVGPTVDRGVAWLKRALDGMELATLMTHEDFVQAIPSSNWNAIMAGVTSGIATYQPEYVTMDYAAQYVRAMHTSNILSSVYNPVAQQLSTSLTGTTDMPTRFYLFTEAGGTIRSRFLDVPVFANSTVVNYSMTPTSVTLKSLQATLHSTELMWSFLALVIISGLIVLLRRR